MLLEEQATLPRRETAGPGFRFILLLGLLDAFGPLGIDMYLPAFPQIERDLQARPGAMQLTLSLFLAGLAVGQLICGPISDRVGRRRPLLFGSAAFAVASVVCAFARSIEALILARFVMGLAGATGHGDRPGRRPRLVRGGRLGADLLDAHARHRHRADHLAVGRRLADGARRAGARSSGRWPASPASAAWRSPSTCPRRTRRSAGPATPPASSAAATPEMLVDRRFMGYAAPVSLALGLIFAYVASAPSLFMQFYGLSPNAFSLIFAANAVGLIGAAQVNRWLTRRYDTHDILRAASLVNAAACLLLPVLAWTGVGGFPAFFADIFLCLATVGLILPNATAAAMAPFPHQAGAASALLGMLQFAVGAATGAIVGIFHDGTGLPMALTIAGCGAISLGICLAGGRRSGRQDLAEPVVQFAEP